MISFQDIAAIAKAPARSGGLALPGGLTALFPGCGARC
jgi:hypothetical protein